MSWSASAAFCSSLMSEGVWPDILKRDLTRNLEKQAKGKDQKKSELLVTHKHALKKKKKEDPQGHPIPVWEHAALERA